MVKVRYGIYGSVLLLFLVKLTIQLSFLYNPSIHNSFKDAHTDRNVFEKDKFLNVLKYRLWVMFKINKKYVNSLVSLAPFLWDIGK